MSRDAGTRFLVYGYVWIVFVFLSFFLKTLFIHDKNQIQKHLPPKLNIYVTQQELVKAVSVQAGTV